MIYASYEYYTSVFLGTAISEADFPRMATLASRYISYLTQGKSDHSSDLPAVKDACCALAEQYQLVETAKAIAKKSLSQSLQSSDPEVSSESVGSWSRSYKTGGESAASALSVDNKQALADIARQHLAGTGLLYRGGCSPCRCSRIL